MKTKFNFYILWLLLMGMMCTSLYIGKESVAEKMFTAFSWGNVGITYDTVYMDRASSYYPSFEQCAKRDSLGNIDSTSNIYNTSDGSFISMKKLRKKEIQWCALPKSMLTDFGGYPFSLGQKVLVYCNSKPMVNGYWEVHDVVSGAWGKTIDFLIHPENNRSPKLGLPKDLVILYNPKPILND